MLDPLDWYLGWKGHTFLAGDMGSDCIIIDEYLFILQARQS